MSADLTLVNDVLNDVAEKAAEDRELSRLLLDKPQLMGVESIGLDTVNLRMVARTLPGKQFDVGRRLRVRVVRALRRAGVVTSSDASVAAAGDLINPAVMPDAQGVNTSPLPVQESKK